MRKGDPLVYVGIVTGLVLVIIAMATSAFWYALAGLIIMIGCWYIGYRITVAEANRELAKKDDIDSGAP